MPSAARRPGAPRLIDFTWGDPAASEGDAGRQGRVLRHRRPRYQTRKRDADDEEGHGRRRDVLALAHMVMDAAIPVRLRVLIPAVENSISGNAFRPLDIFTVAQRASGRDRQYRRRRTPDPRRCALACRRGAPRSSVDMGTLTGAARVALGPELPPFYTDDETLAAELSRHARNRARPAVAAAVVAAIRHLLDSKVADLNNVATGGFAGSIICALVPQALR